MSRLAALLLALLLASCSGLRTHRDQDVPIPRSIAVLPFEGGADFMTRERLRALVTGRVAQEDLLVLENRWVDRRLSERGYLGDPETFEFRQVEAAALCAALGVDAVLAGDMVEYGNERLLLLNYTTLGVRLRLFGEGGRRVWFAEHEVSRRGGVALESGQILNALTSELDYRASREMSLLGWRLVEDIFSTVGAVQAGLDAEEHARPAVRLARAHLEHPSEGVDWIVVEAEGSPDAEARFDLGDAVLGMPMFEVESGRYRGIWIRLPETTLADRPAVRVTLEDRFGHEAHAEEVAWDA